MTEKMDSLNMIVDKVLAYGPSRKSKKPGKAKKVVRAKKVNSKQRAEA